MPLRHLWAGSPCQSADRSPLRHAGMPPRYLWKGSPCRGPVRRTLRHAGMSLKYLWAGLPCRKPVRRMLCRARMPLRHLWAGSPCRRPVRASVSCRSWTGRLAVRHAGMALRCLWEGSPCRSRLWEGLGWCSKQRPLWFARAGWGNRKGTVVASTYSGSPPKKRKRLARQS